MVDEEGREINEEVDGGYPSDELEYMNPENEEE